MYHPFPGQELIEGDFSYTISDDYKPFYKANDLLPDRIFRSLFRTLFPGQSLSTEEPSYDYTYRMSQISNYTIKKSSPNTSLHVPKGKVTKPKKRRKRQCLNMKVPKSKKTTTLKNQSKGKNSHSSTGDKEMMEQKRTSNGRKSEKETSVEEHAPSKMRSPLTHRRRTLYSPKSFEISADMTKVFGNYLS